MTAPAPAQQHSHRADPAPSGPDSARTEAAATETGPGARLAALLTGRRSAWLVLALFALLLVGMAGGLRGAGPAAGMDALPETSESSRAAALAETMEGARYQPVFTVVTRADGGERPGSRRSPTRSRRPPAGTPRAPCPPRTARPIS